MKIRTTSSTKNSNTYIQQMQDEAQKMADKLAKLKSNLTSQKSERNSLKDSSRWENGSIQNKVLQERPPSNRQEPVEQFLKSIKLENYAQKFKENGFEEMDILLDIQKEQLQQMEIPLGHQIRLLKKIRELRESVNESVNESKYEELEQPQVDESFTQVVMKSSLQKSRQKSVKKVQFQVEQSHSILFDQLEEISNYMHENHIGEEFQVEEEFQIQQQYPYDEMKASVLRIKKVACWNCYKLLEKDYIIEGEQEFCSVSCINKYNELYMNNCVKCQKQFDIRNGIILNGCSLCSDECAKDFDFQIMKDDEKIMEQQFLRGKDDVDLNFD